MYLCIISVPSHLVYFFLLNYIKLLRGQVLSSKCVNMWFVFLHNVELGTWESVLHELVELGRRCFFLPNSLQMRNLYYQTGLGAWLVATNAPGNQAVRREGGLVGWRIKLGGSCFFWRVSCWSTGPVVATVKPSSAWDLPFERRWRFEFLCETANSLPPLEFDRPYFAPI